jgi:hypothetical protein
MTSLEDYLINTLFVQEIGNNSWTFRESAQNRMVKQKERKQQQTAVFCSQR